MIACSSKCVASLMCSTWEAVWGGTHAFHSLTWPAGTASRRWGRTWWASYQMLLPHSDVGVSKPVPKFISMRWPSEKFLAWGFFADGVCLFLACWSLWIEYAFFLHGGSLQIEYADFLHGGFLQIEYACANFYGLKPKSYFAPGGPVGVIKLKTHLGPWDSGGNMINKILT
jgi:hypothetical protein